MVESEHGFALLEVVIALFFASMIVVIFAVTNRYASDLMARSRAELEAAAFLESEVDRLAMTPYANLVAGARAAGFGSSAWSILDSVSYRRIQLVTTYALPGAEVLTDTATIVRKR